MKELLKELHHRPIAYYPIYRKITGSTTAGILLSQLMFWWAKMDGQKFYKTDAEIMEETELTEDELKLAKAKIKQFDFIKITRKGMPAVTNYEIDADKLAECVSNPPNKIGGIPQTGRGDSHKLYNIVQENTTENPLTPTSGGNDTQPQSPSNKKAKATKKAGAACAAATEADFSNFANPELALSIWVTWVDYKRQQKNFTYKSDVAQAAAITKLFNCSGGSIQKARAVIEDAMANGYSGFFPYKDEMAASVRPQQIEIPVVEDTFHLEPEMLERYASTTKWFYTKCPACTGIRWLSKKEFLSVMQRSQDLIAEMWYTKCPEEDFNGHVTKSIVSLNAAPRWEKEKWPSIFEWLRHDLKIRIFGKKDNQ